MCGGCRSGRPKGIRVYGAGRYGRWRRDFAICLAIGKLDLLFTPFTYGWRGRWEWPHGAGPNNSPGWGLYGYFGWVEFNWITKP